MLSLLLTPMLVLAISEPIVRPTPDMYATMAREAAAVDPAMVRCDPMLLPAQRPDQDQGGTMRLDRSLDDGQARRYLLLDRRDANNCPMPISYPVPDQPRALGRVYGQGDDGTQMVRPNRPLP